MLWIKYKICTVATDETVDLQTVNVPLNKKLPYTDANYAIAQAEAYQGQITVEDDGQPEPGPEPEYVTYAELAKAIREGVNEV